MDERILKARGWTKKEIVHARRILKKADSKRPRWMDTAEHFMLWTLILVLATASLGFLLQLIPAIVLLETGIGSTFLFVTSACIGLLLVHVLHDLHMKKNYQHAAVVVLIVLSAIVTTRVVQVADGTIGVITLPFIFTLAVVLGVGIPYLIHWRLTHESA